ARMAAYTGSLFVLPGKDYFSGGSWDSIWGTSRPAGLISLSGSIAEKSLEEVSTWSEFWPATGEGRMIRHEYFMDWRDPSSLASNNLPPYLPRQVMLVSWVKK
ncbi:MAG: hypothetical protein PHT33_13325, partial [bacterium]|nr:hypothetical protein [bacterium]